MICGRCKKEGVTVDHVRACHGASSFPAPAPAPAPKKDVKRGDSNRPTRAASGRELADWVIAAKARAQDSEARIQADQRPSTSRPAKEPRRDRAGSDTRANKPGSRGGKSHTPGTVWSPPVTGIEDARKATPDFDKKNRPDYN